MLLRRHRRNRTEVTTLNDVSAETAVRDEQKPKKASVRRGRKKQN